MYSISTRAPISVSALAILCTPSKIDPKHAPLNPPGAAPTLTTLEEHYRIVLAGEDDEPNKAVDGANPTSKNIADRDVSEKRKPNGRTAKISAVAAGKRKMSLPVGAKTTMSSR
ncbi:MAG: hypothetical protein Q9201_006081 [Fulgogasparrea decipioides]